MKNMKFIILTAMILIGAIGYIEKIFKFQMQRYYIIILFILFLILSLAHLKLLFDSDRKAAPRKLSSKQRAKLEKALKTIFKPMPLWFGVLMGDTEAEDYSNEIRMLFTKCGHPVPEERILHQIVSPKPRGIWLYISSEQDSAIAIATELQKAFNSAGLNLQGGIAKEEPGRIRLVVGEKQ